MPHRHGGTPQVRETLAATETRVELHCREAEAETGPVETEAAAAAGPGAMFVVTSNVDAHFLRAGFPAGEVRRVPWPTHAAGIALHVRGDVQRGCALSPRWVPCGRGAPCTLAHTCRRHCSAWASPTRSASHSADPVSSRVLGRAFWSGRPQYQGSQGPLDKGLGDP